MPFQGNRIYIIGFIIFLLAIVAIAVAASGGNGNHTTPAGIVSIIINGDVGISTVKITNQNIIGGSITVMASDLPFKFNCNKGDTIQFTVTTLDDYFFNAWKFDDGTFNSRNPLLIKVDGKIELTADCLIKGETP